MKKIVLTGGPCSGKTSCLNAVKKELGHLVGVVPEVATILLRGGFPIPEMPLEKWPLRWCAALQRTVLTMQQEMEVVCVMLAEAQGKHVVVCDRGQLDGAAYWPSGFASYIDHFRLSLPDVHALYDAVIHLESLAMVDPGLYGKMGNVHRYEAIPEAQAREQATAHAWKDHPNRIFVPGSLSLEEKIEMVLTIIRSHLPTPA